MISPSAKTSEEAVGRETQSFFPFARRGTNVGPGGPCRAGKDETDLGSQGEGQWGQGWGCSFGPTKDNMRPWGLGEKRSARLCLMQHLFLHLYWEKGR